MGNKIQLLDIKMPKDGDWGILQINNFNNTFRCMVFAA